MNNRAIMPKITKPEVALAPTNYWESFLEPKLEDPLHKKKNRSLQSESTTVVVSVTACSTPPITKLFDISIDWTTIEKQLINLGKLFRAGKKLRLNLLFNYIDTP